MTKTQRRRNTLLLLPLAVILAALLTGCGTERKVSPIEPVPSSQEVNNPELGKRAVDPLSFGPGKKGSPSWSPSGERIAFIVDGYVSDKPLSSESSSLRTTRDLGAERMTWPTSGEELVILGDGSPSGDTSGDGEKDSRTNPLYVTRGGGGKLDLERLTKDALAISSSSSDAQPVAALGSGDYESRIAKIDTENAALDTYPQTIEGRVTEISISPDGSEALATVALPSEESGGGSERYEIHAFDLESGGGERLARLDENQEIFGAPQRTSGGIYYVAGEQESESIQDQETEIQYSLYRLPEGSSSPEPVSSVGQDFIVSSIEASPDGSQLALLGRRDSGSEINLYILDLSDDSLYAATANENMEVRTGVDSLDWNPEGSSVAIVARGAASEPKVYNGSPSSLLSNFYNLYEVPADDLEEQE